MFAIISGFHKTMQNTDLICKRRKYGENKLKITLQSALPSCCATPDEKPNYFLWRADKSQELILFNPLVQWEKNGPFST